MSTSDDSLARFIEITSTSPSQAQFYLDSAGGDLDAAVAQFFESGGNDDAAVGSAELPGGGGGASAGGQSAPAPAPAAPQQSGAYTLSGAPVEGLPAGWGSSGGGGSGSGSGSGRSTPRNPLRSNAGPRITGFRDLASSSSGPSGGGRGGGDSDDEEGGRRRDPQQFFAGGARSGLSVENPNNNNNNQGGGGVNDMIQGLLQRATEGSQRLASRRAQEEEEQARPQFFGGSAHTLGSDETPSTYIPDPSGAKDDEEEEEEEEQETAIRHLTFWQDGFSIEDGDLLKYEENQELLAAIQSGRAPLSLLNVRFDQPVELRIAERRNERWVRQPPPPQGPFAGSGNRLGSASPFPDSGAAAASSSAGAGTMPGSFGGAEKAGATGGGGGESAGGETVFEVDRNEPTTQVQIRLRSGERMIATFNHTHTVGDIRRYINASSPSNALQSYVLQTTFPSRDLTDENQTIKEAGVAGSVVVQRPV